MSQTFETPSPPVQSHQTNTENAEVEPRAAAPHFKVTQPTIAHGSDIWRIARNSGELDLNSSYMYLLFARDFAESCRVVLLNNEPIAFVLAYRRVDDPHCLFVWQIAVDEAHQGQGLARLMLDDLIESSADEELSITSIETTVTDDNIASQRLFHRLAGRWGASIKARALFDESHFPDDHETERLHLISPIHTGTD